jgi:hypothetical protein
MAAFFPVLALAFALIAIGRGAASGQFLEFSKVERKRDRIARYVCLSLGFAILISYAVLLI